MNWGDDMKLYLDNAATTPLRPDVKQYIIDILDVYGNPSSIHYVGQRSRDLVHMARQNVAKFINASDDEIIFTSSGSAANTLAIVGYLENEWHNADTLLYSPIAHKSILKCAEKYCIRSGALKVDKFGNIDVKHLENYLSTDDERCLVVIDYANSEIGTIQNVEEIIKIVHEYNGVVVLDCTGSIPYIQLDVKALDVDMAVFSAHKLGALKGCGVLYKKKNIALSPIVYGSQEQGLFGGTENVVGIASLGKAVESYNYDDITDEKRYFLYGLLLAKVPDIHLIGSGINRLPYNLYMCVKGVKSEHLMMVLDMNGYCVSSGSACNSGSEEASPTLQAIGIDKEDQFNCVRITLSGNETEDELIEFSDVFANCVKGLRVMFDE